METVTESLIVKMYVEDKFSAAQIGDFLQISISKVVYTLRKYKVKKRTMSEAITQLNITKFHKMPFRLKTKLSFAEKDLKIAGIMLYWGEGAKTGSAVKFANSNPEMIRVFLMFLRNICGVHENRLKMIFHMYPDQDKIFLESFWSSVTGIELKNFYQPQILKGKVGTYKTKSIYGTATIHYSDKKLLGLILEWIDDYQHLFLK